MFYKLINKKRGLEYGYIFDLEFKKLKLPNFDFDFEKFCVDVCEIVSEDLKEYGNSNVYILNEMKEKELYLKNDFKICSLVFFFISLGNVVCFDVFFYKLSNLYKRKIGKNLIGISSEVSKVKKIRQNKKIVDLKVYEVYMSEKFIVYKK